MSKMMKAPQISHWISVLRGGKTVLIKKQRQRLIRFLNKFVR